MIFTAGNIITLVISLLVIVVLRQKDRNNRTLDLVKKYGGNLKQEIDDLTRQKIELLEQKSIDLNVQQKTTIAAIKRLEEIHNTILARTADMSKVGEQITRYDEVLKELLDMTERAQTSMKALQGEAEFSESLARNLSAAENRLKKIEADIPALQKNFTAANDRALAALKQSVTESFAGDVNDITNKIAIVKERAEALTADAVKNLESQKDAYNSQLSDMTTLSDTQLQKLHAAFNTAFTEAAEKAAKLEHEAFGKLTQKASDRLAEYKSHVETKCRELSDQVKTEMAETKKLADSTKETCAAETAALQQQLETQTSDIKTQWDTDKNRLAAETAAAVAGAEEKITSLDTKVAAVAADLTGKLSATKETLTGKWQEAEAAMTQEITRKDSETHRQLEEFKTKTDAAVSAARQDMEAKINSLAQEMDTSLTSYKNDLAYHFEGLELSLKDINRVEQDLRSLLEQTEQKVTGDFMVFVNDQMTKHKAFESDLNGKFGTLDNRIAEIDSELGVLKNQAANNVSEKLRLFEDEFARDLGKRSEEVTRTLDEWKENISRRLSDIAGTTEEETKKAEEMLSASLHSELQILQEHYKEQHGRIENQITASASAMQARIQNIETTIESFNGQYRQELETARTAAATALQNEIDLHTQNVSDYLKNREKELAAKTQQLETLVQDSAQIAESGITETKEILTTWRTRIDQQVSDITEEINRKFEVLSAGTDDRKQQLDDQILRLSSKVAELDTSLDARQKESVEAFKTSYNEMLAETGSRIKENTDEADSKIREIRSLLQETRTQAESSRDSMITKIEMHASRLQDNLDNIEKRQKDFISQTKIFDRADDLKKDLEGNIAAIKNEIKHIDEFSQSLDKIGRDQERIKRQEEEVSQKLARFIGEKKRIDELDGKFNRIMALSESMDNKLAEFTTNSDMLQQFQIQLKRCQDSMNEIQLKYDRFDNKNKVLDQTIQEIDTAYESLAALEKRAANIQASIQTLPDEVAEFKRDIEKLISGKEKAEMAAEKVETLDAVMADIESRMDKLQKAREWIAGTETRLTTISKQAKDEVRLMGDLLKNDLSSKKSSGAPTIAQRENIRKLAALGWAADKIAANLGLSQGEVELTLEMISDSNG